MIGEKDEKIKFGIKVCLLIAAYILIGLCGLFFILIQRVDALTLSPTQLQCSWNTDANTIRTENCLGGQDYNIGGYTNYVNFLPTFNFSSFFISLNSTIAIVTLAMIARESEIGPAYRIPSIPMERGSISISGIKKMICLVSERIAPLKAFPIEVKKVDVMGCIKFRQIKNRNTLK